MRLGYAVNGGSHGGLIEGPGVPGSELGVEVASGTGGTARTIRPGARRRRWLSPARRAPKVRAVASKTEATRSCQPTAEVPYAVTDQVLEEGASDG